MLQLLLWLYYKKSWCFLNFIQCTVNPISKRIAAKEASWVRIKPLTQFRHWGTSPLQYTTPILVYRPLHLTRKDCWLKSYISYYDYLEGGMDLCIIKRSWHSSLWKLDLSFVFNTDLSTWSFSMIIWNKSAHMSSKISWWAHIIPGNSLQCYFLSSFLMTDNYPCQDLLTIIAYIVNQYLIALSQVTIYQKFKILIQVIDIFEFLFCLFFINKGWRYVPVDQKTPI